MELNLLEERMRTSSNQRVSSQTKALAVTSMLLYGAHLLQGTSIFLVVLMASSRVSTLRSSSSPFLSLEIFSVSFRHAGIIINDLNNIQIVHASVTTLRCSSSLSLCCLLLCTCWCLPLMLFFIFFYHWKLCAAVPCSQVDSPKPLAKAHCYYYPQNNSKISNVRMY